MTTSLLIVEDEPTPRKNYATHFLKKGYEVFEAETYKQAKEYIIEIGVDIVLLDIMLPDGFGPDLINETALLINKPIFILVTAMNDIQIAVEAMKNGAFDFIQKPVDLHHLTEVVQNAREMITLRREVAHYRAEQRKSLEFVIGATPQMKHALELAQRAALASSSVIITGETGTGKELLAKAIHYLGPRRDKMFVDVNCAAIQPTVFESELFGHEKGAFTSAESKKIGLMEKADGGLLFLDEISLMPLDLQAKLLRAIEEREIRRVGGLNNIKVDVQIVAASNRDLKVMMAENTFRQDLYYRLNVVNIHLPPLRERIEDIPELAGLFIHQCNISMGKNIQGIKPRALDALKRYNWPGNIRELRNVIERAAIFCDDAEIDINMLPMDVLESTETFAN